MTNHKIQLSDGIKLAWEAPVFANGRLTHYLVEWTIMNRTLAANVPIQDGINTFKFPNTKNDDRFNITIRAVSEFGAGIPIYINLHNLGSSPSEKSLDAVVKSHDPRLGIAIGVLLSIVCVIVCMWIIVRHRQCVKTRQQTEMNGGIAHHQFQNRSMNPDRTAAATLFPSPPNAIAPNCVIDVHEMQTLIVSATPTTNDMDIKNGKNGGWKCAENGSNGKNVPMIGRDADDTHHSDDDDDNEYECSRRGLISSTPKGQRKSSIIVSSNNLSEQNSSTNHKQNTAKSTTTEPNGDIDAFTMVSSSSKTNILTNGSLRNLTENLPQGLGSHSISIRENDWRSTFATPKSNGNVKRHSQPIDVPLDAVTVFDNSQKKLLDSTIESSSGSSSSCSSQNSSSNNRYNSINCKNNSFENIHTNDRPRVDHNHFHHSVESIVNPHSSSPSDNTIEAITNGIDDHSDEKCTSTEQQPSTIDLNEDSYFQKRLQKWDYRRPIVGPNG